MRGEELTTILLDMILAQRAAAPGTVDNNELEGRRGVVEVGGEGETFIQGCDSWKGSDSARMPVF